jgi:uncharacterized protein (TIGR03435 family)
VTAYTLEAAKPKLRKADPSRRMACRQGPEPGAPDPSDLNPLLSKAITCQNITMAEFAAELQNLAPGYIYTPVLDSTGIEGSWDFSMSFGAPGMVQPILGRGGAGQAGGVLSASDPGGASSLFDAINSQLGLRLVMRRRPMPVLVIDHVEEKPTEN